MDEETRILSNLILAEKQHEDRAKKRHAPDRPTVVLSERDVARVLQAVAYIERWDEREVCTSVRRTLPDGRGSWKTTPEGWPVPSRKLMEEIKKLL
jgi:hypothetical protein